jgi:hypothetical protein
LQRCMRGEGEGNLWGLRAGEGVNASTVWAWRSVGYHVLIENVNGEQ